ncbi:MAG: hypothetical protein ABSA46_08490 [Thermodesulfovibrionales bacterium]
MAVKVPTRQCFVALFDILGFKDIVNNDILEKVWKAYSEIKSSTSFIQDNLESLFKQQIVTVESFSDTFLIYTADYSNKAQEDIDKYFNAILGVCDALFHSANSNGIPIRGAITTGELIVSEGIQIGKPIVETYEMEKRQDWIGCWISDDASRLISEKLLERHIKGNLILKYKIPLKSGDIVHGYVFNWVDLPFENDYDHGMLRAKVGRDEDVERKHRNTRDYIKYVNRKRFHGSPD